MKQMERDLAEKDGYFTSLVTNNKLTRVSLSCKMNDVLQNIFKEIQKFGEIMVSTSSCELDIVSKQRQAQIMISRAPSKSIDNISVTLQATIDTKLDDVTGCALLPDGRMVFSCLKQNLVRRINSDASQCQAFDFSSQATNPVNITYIHDNNSIAVTGGATQHISIIDVESGKVKETIPVKSWNDGIVCRNNTLIFCAEDRGIEMINMSDKSVSNIVSRKMSSRAYITTFSEKFYYTNMDTHTVTCCDLHGTIQWEFTDDSVLRHPYGISVENAGNVYVAGYSSHNVVVISPDGHRHRQLLSDKDGIGVPQPLHYDRSTNKLLVANEKGKAFLYKLE